MTAQTKILHDAANRFVVGSPFKYYNKFKESKIEVTPFSLEEVHKILTKGREDFRTY